MDSFGTVRARVYTSNAYIPLPDAPVSFLQQSSDGTAALLAFRYTDRSGLTPPVTVSTPDAAQSQIPGAAGPPYAVLDILVSYPGYRSVREEAVQVFPGIETIQDIQLQPLGIAADRDPAIGPPQTSQVL